MSIQPFTKLSDLVSCFMQGFPDGRLYSFAKTVNSKFFAFCQGLLSPYYDWLTFASKAIQDLAINVYNPDPNNIWLDTFCTEYGLANYGFDLTSNECKAYSLALFFRIRNATTANDLIAIFADLGYNLTIKNGSQMAAYWDNSYWGDFYWDLTDTQGVFTVYLTISLSSTAIANSQTYWGDFYWEDAYWSNTMRFDIAFVKNILQYLFPCYIRVIIN